MTMAVRRSMSAGLLSSESAGFSKYESELFEGLSVCSAVDYGAGEGMRVAPLVNRRKVRLKGFRSEFQADYGVEP
jgi:hypothetical protein